MRPFHVPRLASFVGARVVFAAVKVAAPISVRIILLVALACPSPLARVVVSTALTHEMVVAALVRGLTAVFIMDLVRVPTFSDIILLRKDELVHLGGAR